MVKRADKLEKGDIGVHGWWFNVSVVLVSNEFAAIIGKKNSSALEKGCVYRSLDYRSVWS